MKKKPNLERQGKVVASLTWSEMLSEISASERMKLKEQVLHDIETFNSKTDKPTPEGKRLVAELRSPQFHFIGFIDNVSYIKASGDSDDLRAKFLHPHGMLALLYFHKPTCTLVIAAPGIRFRNDGPVRGIIG